MDKLERHKKLCNDLHELYTQKNAAYGDSFGDTYKKLGIISAVTRITDKYNRIVNLVTHDNVDNGDESIRDTLIDLANYAIMTIMELDQRNPQKADINLFYNNIDIQESHGGVPMKDTPITLCNSKTG